MDGQWYTAQQEYMLSCVKHRLLKMTKWKKA